MNEENFSLGKVLGCFVVLLVFCLGMDWVVAGQNFFLYKFFAPRQAEVERQVYEHCKQLTPILTKQYRQGNIQRLGTLCLQVSQTDDGHKGMINDIIQQEFQEWDMSDVPAHLQGCLATARAK
jgi:hypothetical protein